MSYRKAPFFYKTIRLSMFPVLILALAGVTPQFAKPPVDFSSAAFEKKRSAYLKYYNPLVNKMLGLMQERKDRGFRRIYFSPWLKKQFSYPALVEALNYLENSYGKIIRIEPGVKELKYVKKGKRTYVALLKVVHCRKSRMQYWFIFAMGSSKLYQFNFAPVTIKK